MIFRLDSLHASSLECSALANNDTDRLPNTAITPTRSFCEIIWDGLLCWPRALAGETLTLPCPPSYNQPLKNRSEAEVATKHCTDNGTWFQKQENMSWTNYSLCVGTPSTSPPADEDDHMFASELLQRWFPVLKAVSRLGYAVSLVTLVISILVLASNKKLRCPRNTLHTHLFFSFLLKAAMFLLKDQLFVQGVGFPSDVTLDEGALRFDKHNNWECKMVVSLREYSILANYSWILMEGLYLHRLIFQALFSDTSAISLYVIGGWGLPCVFVVPWMLARAQWDDTLCWTTHSDYLVYMLIKVPIVLSVLMSFVLFVNIVRVLFLKLRDSRHGLLERRHVRYRRWAKSTLVLVPLFGVHYTVFLAMSYYAEPGETVEVIWLFCDQLFGSFQGCVVAFLYCLLNAEVRCEISRKWHSWRAREQGSRANSVSSVGQGAHEMGTRHLHYTNETTCHDIGEVNRTPRQSADAPLQAAQIDTRWH